MPNVVKTKPIPSESQIASIAAILDAAEEVFGTHGFDGGSMREIAQLAGISQSLLHYHYNNKVTLYEAVFERRARVIQDVRMQQLQDVVSKNGSLEDVLHILFLPLDALLSERRGRLKFYVQMLASVTMSADPQSLHIVKKFYDPSAEHFIAAFKSVEPTLGQDEAVWAYLFAIGARMQAHSPTGRAGRLGATGDREKPYELLVKFVAGGIRKIGA
ncbi:TetR/AcrR family transcriptional regulator [Rhizobium laguerreae]|uniref:TetR/AcrR family transcriptional regulator n=1 Tax=Rhizobium laguerreae TaxID=1076926 RepID=UPI001442A2E3|nr:TetR/AcrR family transcriptional regulator [Rhizobium laguerreae]MBY3321380.1 TetR/AcrR family transcriptional regulator [Rhizobium laguerreae]MBY3362974.1 TetR/AcrR family transcriptional regulator [Rhizobium laguerreae]NKM66483.1 TetR family transcriptional regulator [Rhizobium laguerreae]